MPNQIMENDPKWVSFTAMFPCIIIFSFMTSMGTQATDPHICAAIPEPKLARSDFGENVLCTAVMPVKKRAWAGAAPSSTTPNPLYVANGPSVRITCLKPSSTPL